MNRSLRVLGPALLVVVALASLLLALWYGGGAAERSLGDPGPVVRWGLPIVRLTINIAASLMLGGLILALLVLPPGKLLDRAADHAAAGAAVLVFAAGAAALLSFLNISGAPLRFDADFGAQLGQFLFEVQLGQAWLTTAALAAVVTTIAFATRHRIALAVAVVAAAASLVPIAMQGHAAGASGHNLAVSSLTLHLLGAAVWLGGLLSIAFMRRRMSAEVFPAVLARYSALALGAFVVVAISGIASAILRLGNLADLTTPYGVLIIAKAVALVGLGVLGALHRRRVINRIAGEPERRIGLFWRLAAVELALMGAASGVAAALGRTAPPVPQDPPALPTPAEILTGEPLPPEPTALTWLVSWRFDLIWLVVALFGIALYLFAVHRLRQRGDRWPLHRSILWTLGMLLLFWVTNGALNVYQATLFSTHMLAHMTLAMVIPILLVLGAPITLAMRAIPPRRDGSHGPREWLLGIVHSRFSTFITHPIVAAILFAGSLWAFYYTPIFRWAMADHLGHQWMTVHFLITGFLFAQTLVGIDPVRNRPPYAMRLLLLLATMAFHAFFGLAIMESTGLFLADWFGAMGRTWGDPPLADQATGGGIAWGIGELPTVALAIIVAVQWGRSDGREQKRVDRAADRDGDAELKAYNEELAKLARRD